MEVCFGNPADIGHWMNLVRQVSWNFPGLETERDLEEHRQTVLKFMEKRQALCVKSDDRIQGVLLFSRNRNMICCLAVSPGSRRKGIASKLLEKALSELDRGRDITVSTFREGDEKGTAPRALYRKFGFIDAELTEEFGYPNQVFVLQGTPMKIEFRKAGIPDAELLIEIYNASFYSDYLRYGECPAYAIVYVARCRGSFGVISTISAATAAKAASSRKFIRCLLRRAFVAREADRRPFRPFVLLFRSTPASLLSPSGNPCYDITSVRGMQVKACDRSTLRSAILLEQIRIGNTGG